MTAACREYARTAARSTRYGPIFEPFFTTKDVGVGAGLGLDVSYRIVTNQRQGDIRFSSQPGDTRFQVRLPIEPPKRMETRHKVYDEAQAVSVA